jgi:tRNA (guanine-N7-)-methyltransferase
VPDLGEWMARAMEEHPCFVRLTEAEMQADPVTALLLTTSEEGQKVERNEGLTCVNVFRRIKAPAGLNVL